MRFSIIIVAKRASASRQPHWVFLPASFARGGGVPRRPKSLDRPAAGKLVEELDTSGNLQGICRNSCKTLQILLGDFRRFASPLNAGNFLRRTRICSVERINYFTDPHGSGKSPEII